MVPNKLPEHSYLNECFTYDPETGLLYWKERPLSHFKNIGAKNKWNSRWKGKLALNNLEISGYKRGVLNKQHLLAHRVIYKLVYNIEPEYIDHQNKNKSDNRIENLVNGSRTDNARNQKKFKNNSSGVTGVYWCKRAEKWVSIIGISSKKLKHLGYFPNFEDAVKARKEAEIIYNFHENHGL